MPTTVKEPTPNVVHYVRNKSSRGGSTIGMIVIHTTEGSNLPGDTDLIGLGNFFDQPSVQASSHIANDGEGRDARYVADQDKAWTCSNDNPFTLNVEQIGFAKTTREEWYKLYSHQLANTAKWIAFWCDKYNIPMRRGAAPAGILIKKGIASHKQLGLLGGGHWDPGPSYPMKYVILMARYFTAKERGHKAQVEKLARRINRIRRRYELKEL